MRSVVGMVGTRGEGSEVLVELLSLCHCCRHSGTHGGGTEVDLGGRCGVRAFV
jgi:hypothetical protein